LSLSFAPTRYREVVLTVSKHKEQSTKFKALPSSSQANRLLNKVIAAGPTHFLYVALFDWKQAAGVWTILIDATERRSITVLLQEWTFKD
jgi:hypothetical protein